MKPLFKAFVKMIPRSANWIQLNAESTIQPQEKKKYDNSMLNKINRPTRAAALLLVALALACFVAPERTGGHPTAGWRLSRRQHRRGR